MASAYPRAPPPPPPPPHRQVLWWRTLQGEVEGEMAATAEVFGGEEGKKRGEGEGLGCRGGAGLRGLVLAGEQGREGGGRI